ncbi:growth hormone secretagogue receptor type 1-like [Photinus pyralis]|nr:growth hormone secretagogue receptor type 1-like [Photinus pyralis]
MAYAGGPPLVSGLIWRRISIELLLRWLSSKRYIREDKCKAVPFVELTVAHASVLTILAISFERYYAICKPLKAGYICTKARASFICLLAWFIAAVFTSPILAITQYGLETYYDGTVVSVCFSKVETLLPSLFFILSISVFFFLPLAILLILYALIAKTLIDHPNVMAPCKNNALGSQSAIKYRKQVIIMLGTVVLAFFICLLPFRALTLWIIVVPAESIMNIGIEGYYNLLYFSRIMFHINSAINPILYNLMSSKFRNGFFRLCGIRIFSKRYINRTDINRKNTFNTTSSTQTSSQHTSDSFWSRYSHKNYSRNSTSSKDAKDTLTDPECSKNNNKNSKDSYVRIPLQPNNSLNNSVKKIINGESYV